MSDGETATVGDAVRVLVVGDSPSIDEATDALAASFGPSSLWRERTVSAALKRLDTIDSHCLVCEFDPDTNGSALAELADRAGDVPIIAVTDGSAADRALESGASDVVEPDDPRSVVAARVENATSRHRLAHRDSTRRYRSILEGTDALVFALAADGTVGYANQAVDDRLGYPPDELERIALSRLAHPDDQSAVGELIADIASGAVGEREHVRVRVGRADGTWAVVDLTVVNRLADPLVEGLVATATPVRVDDEGMQSALDRLADPFFALGPDWELRHSNEAARRLFDGSPATGTVVWDLVPEAIRRIVYERLSEATATDSVVEFETADPTADGRLEWTAAPDEDGVSVVVRSAADSADMRADRTRTTRLDRDRLELLESTVDALGDGVAVLEGETIRFANATLFELTDGDALVGRDLDALFDDALVASIRERTASPVVRWLEPVRGTVEADEGTAVDVFVTPLDGGDRTLCVVRDRTRSKAATLSTVSRTIKAVRRADTRTAIRQAVVDGVRDCTESELVSWYRRDESALRPAAVATDVTHADVEPPPVDRPLPSIEEVVEDGESSVHEREGFEPFLERSGLRAERVLVVPIDDRAVVLATSTEPMAFGSLDLEPLDALSAAASVALDRVDARSRVRTCRREVSRLESIAARSEGIQAAERAMLDAETRADVEHHLCESIASLEPVDSTGSIELVWVGRADAGRGTVTPQTRVGRDGEFLESVSIPLDSDGSHPAGRAEAKHEPVVVDDLELELGSSADGSGWRRDAAERGFRAALSLPIEYDGFHYGTVTAYANRAAAFDRPTRTVCRHLASIAGHAISALEQKRALLSDDVLELEVVLRTAADPLSTVAHQLDRRIDVRAVVPRSTGGSTVYCTIPDVTEERFGDLDSLPAVEAARHRDGGNESAVELVLETDTIAELLADHGGVLRSVVPVDDRTRVTFELASSVDVRSFVRLLEDEHPGTELVARRDRGRSVRSARAFDAELRNRLSERQLRTLETAYYGGFFEWPRERTGEEVADSLGVSQPTFSRHFRTAQRKVFELLFDERTGDE
ncbi:bacterio-opsin activator domain-containing protein [Natrialbaceae archaeon A-arb3/5]